MTDTLTIVARIEAAPQHADALEREMRALVADTRRELGCLQYDLKRGTERPELFVFVEEWESEPLWRAHMRGAAIAAFNARIGEGWIVSGEVMQLASVV